MKKKLLVLCIGGAIAAATMTAAQAAESSKDSASDDALYADAMVRLWEKAVPLQKVPVVEDSRGCLWGLNDNNSAHRLITIELTGKGGAAQICRPVPDAKSASRTSVDRYLTCSEWGSAAVLVLIDADKNKRSVEQSIMSLYKAPQPFMARLTSAARETHPGAVKNNEVMRLHDFITGYCFGGGAGELPGK